MTTTPAEAIVRPNGRTYRPRKPPRAVEVDNSDSRNGPSTFIYVLGTHDPDRAYNLAQQLAHVDRESAQLSWARLAPWSGEMVWLHDPVKGAAAVIFDVTE